MPLPPQSDASSDDPDAVRRHAPAVRLNRAPILAALDEILPRRGTVLEVGSGTGEHAAYFARHLSRLAWQPSERSDELLASISAWREGSDGQRPLPNLLPPMQLDLDLPEWPEVAGSTVAYPVAVVAINLVQAMPWSTVERLFDGAGKLLAPERVLYLYGPFRREGRHVSAGNEQLDRDLKSQYSDWGVRDLEALAELGATGWLDLTEVIHMPNNNFSLVFVRRR